jgi:hypothetical protein
MVVLFQEYDFEVIVKTRKLKSRPNHLLHILLGEDSRNLDENIPDAHLFIV